MTLKLDQVGNMFSRLVSENNMQMSQPDVFVKTREGTVQLDISNVEQAERGAPVYIIAD